MPKTPTKTRTLVHIKVTLNYIRPAIWRRLVAPDTIHLGDLSELILAGMGWVGGHLHAFEIGGRQYGDPSMLEGGENERRKTIESLMREGITRFGYTYDFGDNWDHAVLIEKKAPPPDFSPVPACVAGERACPPEDCGGPPGYDGLLAALAAPESKQNRELLEWVGEDWDPEEFSLERANARVRSMMDVL